MQIADELNVMVHVAPFIKIFRTLLFLKKSSQKPLHFQNLEPLNNFQKIQNFSEKTLFSKLINVMNILSLDIFSVPINSVRMHIYCSYIFFLFRQMRHKKKMLLS